MSLYVKTSGSAQIIVPENKWEMKCNLTDYSLADEDEITLNDGELWYNEFLNAIRVNISIVLTDDFAGYLFDITNVASLEQLLPTYSVSGVTSSSTDLKGVYFKNGFASLSTTSSKLRIYYNIGIDSSGQLTRDNIYCYWYLASKPTWYI